MFENVKKKVEDVKIKAGLVALDFMETYVEAQEEAKEKAATIEKEKADKRFYTILGVVFMILIGFLSVNTVYAGDIGGKLKGLADTVKGVVDVVIYSACVAVVAVCLLIRMVSKNPRNAETATEWLKRALIAGFAYSIIGQIVGFVGLS